MTKNQILSRLRAKGHITEEEYQLLKEEGPQGTWIHRRVIAKDRSFDMVVCSNCQTEFSWDAETGVPMDNYTTCPNCRAHMRGRE